MKIHLIKAYPDVFSKKSTVESINGLEREIVDWPTGRRFQVASLFAIKISVVRS